MTTKLYIETPLVYSQSLSAQYNRDVYLKLESLQPSGSFKIRGMSFMMQKALQGGFTEFVCSSGGNAGLAAAYVASLLKTKCTVCVPTVTPVFIVEKLKSLGATVVIQGSIWAEADHKAREIMVELELSEKEAQGEGVRAKAFYVPPFDHADLWEGHSSIVDEIMAQLPITSRLNPNPRSTLVKPAAIAVAVGGGGLLNGVCEGLVRHGLEKDTTILTTETIGSCCLATAIKNNTPTKVKIDSIATSLGASIISDKSWEYTKQLKITPILVSDAECVNGITQLLNDHNILVEPACGSVIAGLTVIFDQEYRDEIKKYDHVNHLVDGHCTLLSCTTGVNTPYSNVHMPPHTKEHINGRFFERLAPQMDEFQWARQVPESLELDSSSSSGPIVVIVCGGSLISPQMLRHFQHLTQCKHFCREHDVGYEWIEQTEALNLMVRK